MKTSGRFLILVTVVTSVTWTHAVVVNVIGQEGHLVTLHNEEKTSEVTWRFGNNRDNIGQAVISITRGMPIYGDGWRERASISSTNVSLIIKILQKTDFGFFSCYTKSRGYTIYRLYRATASQKLVLRCMVDSPLKPTFEWVSPENQKMSETSNTLTVSNVTPKHGGTWTCVITLNQRRTDIVTSVNVADIIQPHFEIIYTSVSSPATLLSCFISLDLSQLFRIGLKEVHWTFQSFSKNYPEKIFSLSLKSQMTASWKKQQTVDWLINENLHQKNLSIVRNKSCEECAGLYTCALIFNNSITINKTVQVEVLKVSSSPEKIFEGQEVNLTCSPHLRAQLERSNLRVKWIPPPKSSLKKDPALDHKDILTIRSPTAGEHGKWRCELRRGETLVTWAELTLKIEKAPVNVWLLVCICGAVVAFLLFFFLTVTLIRQYKQRVVLRRRRRKIKYCCCKHPQPKGFYKT